MENRGMKVVMFAFFVVLLFSSQGAAGAKVQFDKNQKLEPEWKTLGEGLALAKTENKKLMVDIYTDWCGWCKKLDAEVYSNDDVRDYLQKNFVSVKLNAESNRKYLFNGTERSETEIAQIFGVTGYPSILFMLPEGKGITLLPGYVPAETFINVLKYINEDQYKSLKWSEYLEKIGKASSK
jgi:thioredoxin-related protein